jgi:hypothetical protein
MAFLTSFQAFVVNAQGMFDLDSPAVLVVLLSLVMGLLMVVVFRYTSDQTGIRIAKDHLQAHLLAVQLFQDQLPVVLTSYGRILISTGSYLRLAFKPLLFVILPLTFLMVQLDRYLGSSPLPAGQAFLLTAHTSDAATLDEVTLSLPPEMTATAPAVHVPADNEVVWRVVAGKGGAYNINVTSGGETVSKLAVVGTGLSRLSLIRLRGHFWERFFSSGEPALPGNNSLESVEVNYPSRNIRFAGIEWNWIWLFFVLSMVAGFFFKTVLKIEI